jgi:hypothetical protein
MPPSGSPDLHDQTRGPRPHRSARHGVAGGGIPSGRGIAKQRGGRCSLAPAGVISSAENPERKALFVPVTGEA